MESIGALDARTRLAELLERAARGESFIITRDGQPVARLVPESGVDAQRVADAVRRLKAFRGMLKGVSVVDLLRDRDEGRRF